ncbi:glycosyltransferase family 61 protein [Acidisoma cladoniae]|uniref:glycosyltransferase family 61 protein n=1 Tax=Acidisoma cladoniae TaxID=3040935 RepID=UPI00254AD024|nr:glycosyltransferase family 61 protein [Acidisoma sp. PAMC 29798]
MPSQDWFPMAAQELNAPDPTTAGLAPGMTMLAHISMRGDIRGQVGSWLGAIGSGLALEGMMSAPASLGPPHLSPGLEYQLLYPYGLKTPWMAGGQPCGSAGLGLGCIGLRFRLSLETAPFFSCTYDVTFVDGTRLDDVPSPGMASVPSGPAVEAVRVKLKPSPPLPVLVLNDLDRGMPPPWGESPLDDQTIRLRLLSPAFATRRPTIRNAGLIPAEFWAAMEGSWQRGVFAPRPISFRLLNGAFVAHEGLVFDREMQALAGTTRLFEAATVAEMRAEAAAMRTGHDARRINGFSVLCKTRAVQNFGHYLIDMFPKAWLAHRLLAPQGLTFIVHDSALMPVIRDSLTIIGIRPEAIVATGNAPVVCERLLVIDGLTSHGDYQSPICVQALSDLAERLPAAPFPKLFIRRQSRKRPLINEAEVERVLTARGFIAVDPGQMSLAEQIVLFKGARIVVGALGAAMTNIVFCAPGATVVALTAASFPDTFFWYLSQHRGHHYTEVRGPDASADPALPEPWETGFTIGAADLDYLATL